MQSSKAMSIHFHVGFNVHDYSVGLRECNDIVRFWGSTMLREWCVLLRSTYGVVFVRHSVGL